MAWYHPPKKRPLRRRSDFFLLDRFSAEDIRHWTAFKDKILRFHWEHYSALAFERSKIADKLREALLQAAGGPFEFKRWQRLVKYKYTLEPLSTAGSLKEPGGRFNIPDINPQQFPPFPALYVAEDKETALAETLGQRETAGGRLSASDLALTKKDSVSIVSVSGRLDSVIDLHQLGSLQPFLDLIKDFPVPGHLIRIAKEMGVEPPRLVGTVGELETALLGPRWRAMPMQFDVPASCQIFGQLVAKAAIEGILYPSRLTGMKCLAIFTEDFENDSFVELDDRPPAGTKVVRLDAGSPPKD